MLPFASGYDCPSSESSEQPLSSLTATPQTLLSDATSRETTDRICGDNRELTNCAHDNGDLMVPMLKSDGTIVIPRVVHVNDIRNLAGVALELNVLIKSPDEARQFSVKIDCPEFKPSTVMVNGIKTKGVNK
ncbi:unnamed protein product [Gongylonema pulchrum]|uniref:Uncharacterized protein n=1 Tax=Gongylonema pulchrum TaxID=637853 RepID=A0A183CWJ1_9BILA|nr:unnamed protein product [Gongylonema pulchrum]